MKLDGATFLLQWATGGLAFMWVTTRRREVSLGYGWLLRGVFGVMAIGAVALFATQDLGGARSVAFAGSILVVVSTAFALIVSIVRRKAGVSGRAELRRAGGPAGQYQVRGPETIWPAQACRFRVRVR